MPRSHRRFGFHRLLGVSLAVAAATGPALAEAKVQRGLRERLGLDDRFAVALDLGGLELRGLQRTLPGNRGRTSAERVRVRPSFDGIVVEIEGLDVVMVDRAARAATTAGPRAPGPRSVASADGPTPTATDPLANFLVGLRGVPIELVTHGRVEVELADGVRATATDLRAKLPGDGRIFGSARFTIGAWAQAELEFAAIDERPRELRLAGNLDLAGEVEDEARRLAITGQLAPTHATLDLREAEGGRASLRIDRGFEAASEGQRVGRDRMLLEAEALPLGLLEPAARLLGRQFADVLGERDARLDLEQARISGTLELVRGAGLTRARLEAVELSQLTLASPLLAPEPVHLADLTFDGELVREHTPTGPRSSGDLLVTHAGVSLRIAGQLDDEGLEFGLELPTTSCQAVLDALPGVAPVLAGSELRGELDGRASLRLDFAALAQARARYLGEGAEELDLDSFVAPGELRFDLPYLERCEVARLGPQIDVEGLAGPYRHRFATGSGVEKRRVLAPGDDGYVRLEAVPKLALAFVILEDARFWDHDGFDREQIERAFWYNLLEGKVRRGASTISQQTTRSLWLGTDRSITRKLAEAMLAAELERGLDKRRILEVYLNVIELGPEVHGVVEGARHHFGKRPEQLDLIEALHLASMAPAPVAYSRRFAEGKLDAQWREHLRAQVRRLRIRRLITREQAESALRSALLR
jgi:hypothetical protein